VRSLWLWVRGRRAGVGPEDLAIGYAEERLPFLVVLAGVLTVETAVVGLLVPWWWIHVLDVLTLVQVLAIAAGLVTHPHVLTPDTLVLRNGRRTVLVVPRAAIADARAERRYHDGRTEQRDGGELRIVVGNQTDVVLLLDPPVDGMSRVRFRADDPRVALTSVNA
jgi:hypothetical protein